MKRGASGLSLVLPVYKPSGMSSHDVVNKVRRIMGERRVGHAGTLDPLAEGVLPILVGPATRLDRYVASHDKSYTTDVMFGVSTTTDDSEGEIVHSAPWPKSVLDPVFAASFCEGLVGKSKQIPPVYSAIKVDGRKACDEARKGNVIHLEPRDIEVYSAQLLGIGGAQDQDRNGAKHKGMPFWTVSLSVSKGTYIRALARDIGVKLGTFSHVGALRRDSVGTIGADECVSLEALERLGATCAIDPMRLLEMRVVFLSERAKRIVSNGGRLSSRDVEVFDSRSGTLSEIACCIPSVTLSIRPLEDGELVAVIVDNRLVAVYSYDEEYDQLKPDCIFHRGVSRGYDI